MATLLTAARPTDVPDPPLAKFLFADKRMAPIWLLLRLYVGWQWLSAGWEKLTGDGWVGRDAGKGMAGLITGALKQTTSVQPYYAWFLQHVVQPHLPAFSYAVAIGETLVGLGLIVGLFTGIAAFFGGLMNANYLLAGTISVNPPLFILATGLVLAWKVAGLIGLDAYVLPKLGVPGAAGTLFPRRPRSTAAKVNAARTR